MVSDHLPRDLAHREHGFPESPVDGARWRDIGGVDWEYCGTCAIWYPLDGTSTGGDAS
ncbi:hypothetical protein [Nocardia wallacei]|uniref:hypothetical protein n=1 Tax=Nocardia wallacei TaxID=480035 RepID=UPI0024580AA1|nr:hypothetical protein [Nocardia wallacei]